MKIFKSISIGFLTATLLLSCGSSKTASTNTTANDAATKATEELLIVTATDSVVPRKAEMTREEIYAWPHMDIFTDSVPGMSLEKAYKFLEGKPHKKIIVGVIDSGVDIEHEDLNDVIWVNEDEIPDNGIDDDNNGYIDDVHGWNFLGGEKGTSNPEQLEMTRMVKRWQPKFEGKTIAEIAPKDTTNYNLYLKLKQKVKEKSENAMDQKAKYTALKNMIIKANDTVKKVLGNKEMNVDNLNALKFDDPALMQGKMIMMQIIGHGETIEKAYEDLDGAVNHYKNQAESQYKIDFDGRVAGDDPYDITDIGYGNSYVIGSKDDESHGTHVSGIIAAERNNGIGMNGVTNNLEIMAVRAVPDGDEYDKDVALAIRYAADNGAKVVNMSFGKSYSPNAEWVYDAIKYAEEKDVLLVHAAGNDGANIDVDENYPNDSKDKINEFADNVITVGAMSRNFDENLLASFSNYGKINVDVFAPGLEIYSTYPKNEYEISQGTSMAAPQVAGVAALVRSYYPQLTAAQVKKIIMDSGIVYNKTVILPGSDSEKTDFSTLSVSGRILNAYNAVKLAEKMVNKR
ncbi:MAG: peptidase S8 [Flavobacteriales bacterium]|nr:MAG: peptidase S8 [Flavobacteriales bacterium]